MKRFAVIALVMLVVFSALFVCAEHFGWLTGAQVKGLFDRWAGTAGGRWLIALAIVLLLLADLVLPVPSSVVMAGGGMYLGWPGGVAASFAGTMLAALVAYYGCRYGGRRAFSWLAGAREDEAQVRAWFERYGLVAIIVSRPVPMLTEILSCLAGLAGIRARAFFLAAALGNLATCVVYCWFGSRAREGSVWPALLAALLIPAAGWVATRRLRRRAAAAEGGARP